MRAPRCRATCSDRTTARPARALARARGSAPAIVAVLLVSLALTAAGSGTALAGISNESWSHWSSESLRGLLHRGLERHPSLMLAAFAALCVPALALITSGVRCAQRIRAASRAPSLPTLPVARSDGTAWIELANAHVPPVAIGEMVRIGRSEDCDLAIERDGLAEMHALIQRTPEREFVLFDVSGGEGELDVNGTPAHRRQLYDGDRIEIGAACIVFRLASSGSAMAGSRAA